MTISPADLHAREASKTLVLDVRAPGEFAAGHLPGAVNLPLDSLAALLPELADAAGRRELFVVCATGRRSADARERLAAAGIAATGVEGGTDGWTAAGLPVEQGPAPARATWAMDRQVRFAAARWSWPDWLSAAAPRAPGCSPRRGGQPGLLRPEQHLRHGGPAGQAALQPPDTRGAGHGPGGPARLTATPPPHR
ncbi:rhodanese-like domain-containing protein [Actinomadura keratinilytica]